MYTNLEFNIRISVLVCTRIKWNHRFHNYSPVFLAFLQIYQGNGSTYASAVINNISVRVLQRFHERVRILGRQIDLSHIFVGRYLSVHTNSFRKRDFIRHTGTCLPLRMLCKAGFSCIWNRQRAERGAYQSAACRIGTQRGSGFRDESCDGKRCCGDWPALQETAFIPHNHKNYKTKFGTESEYVHETWWKQVIIMEVLVVMWGKIFFSLILVLQNLLKSLHKSHFQDIFLFFVSPKQTSDSYD